MVAPVEMTFVVLSQFLKRKAHVSSLEVWQFQTVIQTEAVPVEALDPTVRSNVHMPLTICAPISDGVSQA